MNMMRKILAGITAAALIAGAQAEPCQANDGNAGEILYQVSTIQALTAGDYYGSMTIEELLQKGNIGLGTFNKLDGEMIVLDGVCYKAKDDGTVEVVPMDETAPFATVTWLDEDKVLDMEGITSLNDLKSRLNTEILDLSPNYIYAARLDGEFNTVYVRSEPAQKEPYRTLDVVLAEQQTEFTYDNIKGTMVAIYCPDYMSGINAAGWHLHFISADRKKGGHVLDMTAKNLRIILDRATEFDMKLPYGDYFQKQELTKVAKETIDRVELGKK